MKPTEVAREFLGVIGKVTRTITRADGTIEESVVYNQVTKDGLNFLASRGITNTGSAMAYIIVGTQTAAGSLGSVQGGIGEVSRKIGVTLAASNEVMVAVATWQGTADSVTSVDLRSAGLTNHADSGQGTFFNHVNSVATILANSDYLKLQMEIQVGSHAL